MTTQIGQARVFVVIDHCVRKGMAQAMALRQFCNYQL
jgi:hypothetical protein